jgi:hypothetical protein
LEVEIANTRSQKPKAGSHASDHGNSTTTVVAGARINTQDVHSHRGTAAVHRGLTDRWRECRNRPALDVAWSLRCRGCMLLPNATTPQQARTNVSRRSVPQSGGRDGGGPGRDSPGAASQERRGRRRQLAARAREGQHPVALTTATLISQGTICTGRRRWCRARPRMRCRVGLCS